ATIARDLRRLGVLLRQRLGTDIAADRLAIDEGFLRVLRQAWTSFAAAPKGSRSASEHLAVITRVHEARAKLLGVSAADEARLRKATAEADGGIGAFLASLAVFEEQERIRYLATATDEDLVPHARDTNDLVGDLLRRFGKLPATAGEPAPAQEVEEAEEDEPAPPTDVPVW
ncbi:MAG TPA: hypothetical protein VFU72_08640, partial [Nitrolancea sp.]|nr:hypothetical protein [Nitrolancea sp.]